MTCTPHDDLTALLDARVTLTVLMPGDIPGVIKYRGTLLAVATDIETATCAAVVQTDDGPALTIPVPRVILAERAPMTPTSGDAAAVKPDA